MATSSTTEAASSDATVADVEEVLRGDDAADDHDVVWGLRDSIEHRFKVQGA